MKKEDLPEVYQQFIDNSLFKDSLSSEEITTLFNLHNNYINVHYPEFGKSCSACVNRVWQKVKETYSIQMGF